MIDLNKLSTEENNPNSKDIELQDSFEIIKRIINLTKVKREINLLLITDILWIIFYNILIFIDSKIY